jgi:hypothetical protein
LISRRKKNIFSGPKVTGHLPFHQLSVMINAGVPPVGIYDKPLALRGQP